MQRQCPIDVARDIVNPHSPHVIAAAAYSEKFVHTQARTRAWHHRPCAPIPMQYHRAKGIVVPHSPNVVAAACYCCELVVACGRIRACHVGPCAPVPMQRERPTVFVVAGVPPNSPHVAATAGYSVEW